ncbi:pleckstrin y domain-containing family f member 2-related [Holotrichia oblita]|uniref:Pleckstrin y domain-containing family f member 2-related n=1 Tax=Holotrichia oblita TaxID=644536 RepID=A0ACB9TJ89_HOLOL|nr:pleckstrin y domain-containing family f member 2-related [Holotrichia oblita]
MALINTYNTYRLSNYLCSILKRSSIITSIRTKAMVVDFDVLDDFTTQLMQKKANKWENIKIRKQLPITKQSNLTNTEVLKDGFNEMNFRELNVIFEKYLDENNHYKLFELIETCIDKKICPSDMILTNMLTMFAQISNTDGINKLQELCSVTNPEFLKVNSNFQHYRAETIWLRGNVSKAIEMFEDTYKENQYLRRRIRLMLKHLLYEAVSKRSEAVLVNLVNFTERLAKNYNDYYLMTCLWQVCFLSEWFSDQQVAFDLLERYSNLRRAVINQIPCIVSISLKYHKTDPVYRLLEILLKYEMKLQSSIILVALFDYRFKQGDLRSCCEIVKWSAKHKIMLPSVQHEKFLRLLLREEPVSHKHKQIQSPTYLT